MMLAVDDVTFSYRHGAAPVLDGVSISLAPGEVVGLMGPSGSGKSTLGRLLAGYLTPQRGKVSLAGNSLPKGALYPVQLLFQTPEFAVNPRWNVRDILCEAHPADKAQWARFGISDHWLDRLPHELSGGELQRVCIARAIGPGVRFLIADEISGTLDTITQAEVWHALLACAAQSRIGILAISHDRVLLARICSRILLLDRARISAAD